MKMFIPNVGVFVFTLVTCLALGQTTSLQSWTSNDGKVIEAEFVKLEGETLLMRVSGKEFQLPLTRLSPESQEQARRLAGMPVDGQATKEQSFENSLGMKFVPVPGTDVLFCVHETTVANYAAYADANPGVDMKWKGQKKTAQHPVVNVSYDDVVAFCAWLSKKEGKTYRLPTDHEWSCAVGIGGQEDEKETPRSKHKKIEGVYPWGKAWPPPAGAGNFFGEEWEKDGIKGYRDPHKFTAPVGSYAPSKDGIFDLGGNVEEWCQDLYDPSDPKRRVLRGASWFDRGIGNGLRSSCRNGGSPHLRLDYFGFRVVLVRGVSR